MVVHLRQFFVFLSVLSLGCDGVAGSPDLGASDSAIPGADGWRPGPDALPEGTIAIYVMGDQSPVAFVDGYAGQTVSNFEIALSRYQILLGAADPSPVLCFDLGATPTIVDVARDNLVGTCRTSTIPTGSYTHGRTKVDWSRYTVEGVLHSLAQSWPGQFTYFRAYSDTLYDGRAYVAGTGKVTFTGAVGFEYDVVYPPLVDGPAVQYQTVNGEMLMTFAYSHPLPINQGDEGKHWARFNWKTYQAFRWLDAMAPDYQTGVWDVAAVGTESVMMYGVSSYYVTSSVD
jgi:hypothetical protein